MQIQKKILVYLLIKMKNQSLLIKTPALPNYMPEIYVDLMSDDTDHFTLINYRPSQAPFMVDRKGILRCFLDVKEEKYGLIPLNNGNLAYGLLNKSKIIEYSWMGELKNIWHLRNNYNGVHHDIVEKPNTDIFVTVNKAESATIEDHVFELKRDSGEVICV